jgi:mono/diheme cytochrome c family protein
MKGFASGLLTCLLSVAIAIGAGWLYFRHAAAGFSARSTPTPMEASLAAHARSAAMPASVTQRQNPIAASPEVMHEAMEHYADHCAVCHANNGSGDTMLGNGMYPRPPDMRSSATQSRSDGELFSIIENGIRLSGMPAFGSPDHSNPASEADSWKLVLFLRHLPQITSEELATMGSLNPKSPDEIEEEKQEAEFLRGGNVPSPVSKK